MGVSSESSTPTIEKPKVEAAVKPAPPQVDKLPPFHVVLHNDDVNDFGYVVMSLISVTPVREKEAVQITMAAHTRGRCLVLTTHKERAELYRDRLASRHLTATIEPAL